MPYPSPRGLLVAAAAALWLSVGAVSTQAGPYHQLPQLAAGAPIPEESFLSTSLAVDEFLQALGTQGRVLYRQAQWWDFCNAALLAASGGLLLLWLAAKLPPAWSWSRGLALLPLATGLADAVENVLTLLALAGYPRPAPAFLPWVTSAKLVGVLAYFLAVAVLASAALALRRRARS